MLEGVNPNARHPGKGLERATFHHGVELSYCLVTVRVTVLLRFDAQLIPVAKNLTLLFFCYHNCIYDEYERYGIDWGGTVSNEPTEPSSFAVPERSWHSFEPLLLNHF